MVFLKKRFLLFVLVLFVVSVSNSAGQQVFEKSFDLNPPLGLNELVGFIKGYETLLKMNFCLRETERYLEKVYKEIEGELKYFEKENLAKSPKRIVDVWSNIRIYSGRISHYLKNVKEIIENKNMVIEDERYSLRDFSIMERKDGNGEDRISAFGFPLYELQEPRNYTGARKIYRRKFDLFRGMELNSSNYGQTFLKKALESGEYCVRLINDMGEDRSMFEYSMEKTVETRAVTFKRKEEIVVMENVFTDLYKYSKLQEEIYRIHGE
jgi:hypothetical protein